MAPVNPEAAALSGEQISFSFGQNWQRFLKGLTPAKVEQAQESLRTSLGGADLRGRTFLDIGSGSGLFSLAAHRLGATVTSVDVDAASIACVQQLRADNPSWTVVEASILREHGLAPAEVVYSWGVLHHTGDMWRAVARAFELVAPGGLACIALYNRPHHPRVQVTLKRMYNRLGPAPRRVMVLAYGLAWLTLGGLLRRRNPIAHVRNYGEGARGMTFWRDVEDWLGGLPFEYTDVQGFRDRVPHDFELISVLERPPGACNEYLLRRMDPSAIVS